MSAYNDGPLKKTELTMEERYNRLNDGKKGLVDIAEIDNVTKMPQQQEIVSIGKKKKQETEFKTLVRKLESSAEKLSVHANEYAKAKSINDREKITRTKAFTDNRNKLLAEIIPALNKVEYTVLMTPIIRENISHIKEKISIMESGEPLTVDIGCIGVECTISGGRIKSRKGKKSRKSRKGKKSRKSRKSRKGRKGKKSRKSRKSRKGRKN